MRNIPLPKLQQDTRRIVAELRADKTALIVGDDGEPVAYLVDPQAYEEVLHRLSLLDQVSLGERDVAEGRTLTHAQLKEKLGRWLK
jgi:PHD/YefM family antitoxin component YafN of YafNO toxin-antitoxin module